MTTTKNATNATNATTTMAGGWSLPAATATTAELKAWAANRATMLRRTRAKDVARSLAVALNKAGVPAPTGEPFSTRLLVQANLGPIVA